MEEKQKKHSRSCAFCLYEVLLAHLAETHEDCGNLCAGCVVLRIQLAVRAVHDTVGNRPLHCIYSVAADGRSVREAGERPARRRGTGVAVQHGNELLTELYQIETAPNGWDIAGGLLDLASSLLDGLNEEQDDSESNQSA